MSVAVECPEPPVVAEEAHPAPALEEEVERPHKKVRAAAAEEPVSDENEPTTKKAPGGNNWGLINCTPHEVHYYQADDSVLAIPSTMVLRAKLAHPPHKSTLAVEGVEYDIYDDPNPVLDTEDFPRLRALAGKTIVVSRPMAMAIKESKAEFGMRVLTPNSESATKQGVRNEKGELRGVRSFIDWGML